MPPAPPAPDAALVAPAPAPLVVLLLALASAQEPQSAGHVEHVSEPAHTPSPHALALPPFAGSEVDASSSGSEAPVQAIMAMLTVKPTIGETSLDRGPRLVASMDASFDGE